MAAAAAERVEEMLIGGMNATFDGDDITTLLPPRCGVVEDATVGGGAIVVIQLQFCWRMA